MKPSRIIWLNGKLIPWDQANVHVLTHSLHYGAGVFEGIKVYDTQQGPAIFRLNDHIDRLYKSFAVFEKAIPYNKEELTDVIIDLVNSNNIRSGYIRPLVYFGYGDMKLNLDSVPVDVAIAAWEWDKHLGDHSIRVIISDIMRIHPKSSYVDCKIVGHYVNSILAHSQARKRGYDEAILLDYKGALAEGAAANIFLVKNNILKTPLLESILPGITRDTVIQIARELGIVVEETTLYTHDLEQCDEAFLTGTATEISAIQYVHEKLIAIGSITQNIKKVFENIVANKSTLSRNFLTFTQTK